MPLFNLDAYQNDSYGGTNLADLGLGASTFNPAADPYGNLELVSKFGNNPTGIASAFTTGAVNPTGPSFTRMQRAFGGTDPTTGATTGGYALPAISALTGLAEAVLGFKQFGLAKKTFKEQRNQFDRNFRAQAKTINSQFSDRQRARLASNPNAYQSEAEYLSRFGINQERSA